jgi:hypothetical protein
MQLVHAAQGGRVERLEADKQALQSRRGRLFQLIKRVR